MGIATDQKVETYGLDDRAWALKQVLERAHTANLSGVERERLARIEQWVSQVDPLLTSMRAGHENVQAPPLGLAGSELHDLVTKVVINQHPDPKRRRQLARLWHNVEHLHRQSTPLKLSSWLIAAGLVVLAALNVLDLVVLKDLPRPLVFGLNLGVVLVVGGFWAWHHFGRLLPHIGDVEEHIVSVLAMHKHAQ
jgi:hypothetical protein